MFIPISHTVTNLFILLLSHITLLKQNKGILKLRQVHHHLVNETLKIVQNKMIKILNNKDKTNNADNVSIGFRGTQLQFQTKTKLSKSIRKNALEKKAENPHHFNGWVCNKELYVGKRQLSFINYNNRIIIQ